MGAAGYGKEYFEKHLGHFAYTWDEPHWLAFFDRIAEEIVARLKPRTVLDVGCGIGFLVEALRRRGVAAYGVDISEYAISQVPGQLQTYCRVASAADPLPNDFPQSYDLITCIEVLEHIPEEQAKDAVRLMAHRTSSVLFSSTPHDANEPTHINLHPVLYWLQLFAEHGFYPDLTVDAGFIAPQAFLLTVEPPKLREELLPFFARSIDKNFELAYQHSELGRKEEQVKQLREEREQLSQEVAGLQVTVQRQQQALAAIHESMAWMLVVKYRSLRDRFLPSGTGRRKAYNLFKDLLKVLFFGPRPIISHPQQILLMARSALRLLKTEGVSAFGEEILHKLQDRYEYERWAETYDILTELDRAAIRRHVDQLPYKPFFSVVMPTYNTREKWLRLAIESVRNQLYSNWELCIADDASSEPHVRQVLEEYGSKDSRIKVLFREKNGHISAASNSALEVATGQFIVLLDHDDTLAEHALYMVAVELNTHPEADLIYSDEDKIDLQGRRHSPYFKPDWNPDLLTAQNFVSHLGVYRARLVRETGGFRTGYDGSQDWDLAMRVAERVPASHIRHIPHILYHWRAIPGSAALGMDEKRDAIQAQMKTVQSHFDRISTAISILRRGIYWRVKYPLPKPPPSVTLIVPTRNGFDLLYRCVESIFRKTTYPNFELIIVDNQSDNPATLNYLTQLERERKVRVLRYDASFNYSAINNFAAQYARGEIIGLINNDLEVITPEWLEEMVSQAARPEIGAVGAMLYYPDNTIQHAGVILGLGGVAGHPYKNRPRGYSGQASRALLCQNLSAVTGACMVLRWRVFEEVGGLDETHLPIAFNDVDLCLRIREQGYRILWTPYAQLYHHESFSRGYEETLEKQARFQREVEYMKQRWGELLLNDPAYNLNLTLDRETFMLAFPPRAKKPWLIQDIPGEMRRQC